MIPPTSPHIVPRLRAGRDAGPRGWGARALGFALFIPTFLRELVLANLSVARTVLFRRVADLAPDFLEYDVSGLRPLEIVVLTHCITLTPGTTSVKLDDACTRLVVHALDGREPDEICLSIKRSLEDPILRWTR